MLNETKDYKTALKVLWPPTIASVILTITLILLNLSSLSVLGILISILISIFYIWLIKKNYSIGLGKSILICILFSVMISLLYLAIVAILWMIIMEVPNGAYPLV